MLTLRMSTLFIGSRRTLPRPTLSSDGTLVNPRRKASRRAAIGSPVTCERCGGACFIGSRIDPLPCEACEGTGRLTR
jgi:DnaJ-class molecular chaperone